MFIAETVRNERSRRTCPTADTQVLADATSCKVVGYRLIYTAILKGGNILLRSFRTPHPMDFGSELSEAHGWNSHTASDPIPYFYHLCPPEAQKAIVEALAPFGDSVKVVIHDGVGHAYARRGGVTSIRLPRKPALSYGSRSKSLRGRHQRTDWTSPESMAHAVRRYLTSRPRERHPRLAACRSARD